MLALVRSHVDQLRRPANRAHCRFNHLFRRRDERNHRTIVIGVDVHIEHTRRINRRDSFSNGLDRFGISPFAKVWNTLNETGHGFWSLIFVLCWIVGR